MGENTKIEWADHTFNPWRGCVKVSPACDHCYAERGSFRNPKLMGVWGSASDGGTRVLAAEAQWNAVKRWNKKAEVLRAEWDELCCEKDLCPRPSPPPRPKVFCASLADVFEEWDGPMLDSQGNILQHCFHCGPVAGADGVSHCERCDRIGGIRERWSMNDTRAWLFETMERCPHLDWQLLTKRPENIIRMVPYAWLNRWPVNVWMGTTAGNQEQADVRIPYLRELRENAGLQVAFVSCEPLLGQVDLGKFIGNRRCQNCSLSFVDGAQGDEVCANCYTEDPENIYVATPYINWVITGGETGPGARPSHPDWFRSLRDQCNASDVPFFFKQWGEWIPFGQGIPPGDWADETRYSSQSLGGRTFLRVGKKTAGRLLDGRQWNQFPETPGV